MLAKIGEYSVSGYCKYFGAKYVDPSSFPIRYFALLLCGINEHRYGVDVFNSYAPSIGETVNLFVAPGLDGSWPTLGQCCREEN